MRSGSTCSSRSICPNFKQKKTHLPNSLPQMITPEISLSKCTDNINNIVAKVLTAALIALVFFAVLLVVFLLFVTLLYISRTKAVGCAQPGWIGRASTPHDRNTHGVYQYNPRLRSKRSCLPPTRTSMALSVSCPVMLQVNKEGGGHVVQVVLTPPTPVKGEMLTRET